MVISFPSKLKEKSENPVVDFYKKCIDQIDPKMELSGLDVTAFTVNPKDYKKLEKKLQKYIKSNFPKLPARKVKFETSFIMLDIGPCVSMSVEEGKVLVEENNLYGIA